MSRKISTLAAIAFPLIFAGEIHAEGCSGLDWRSQAKEAFACIGTMDSELDRTGKALTAAETRAQGLATELSQARQDLEGLRVERDAALTRLDALEATAHRFPEIPRIPKGAVVAFDTPDTCPDGWSPFAPAASRTIIGAYNGGDAGRFALDPADQPLTQYKYREHDGWEMVTLTPEQMPRHNHDRRNFKYLLSADGNYISDGTALGRKEGSLNPNLLRSGEILPSGESQSHNNMPPYIALYFCKKN
jgi:hypothetical protein